MQLATEHRALVRPAAAVEASLRRKALWPGVPQHLFEVAREIAQCIPLLSAGPAAFTGDIAAEEKRYGDLAIGAPLL